MLREIIKKRVGPDGVEVECDADESKWVDIKETTKATYKRGRGRRYKKTIYTYKYNSSERTYEDEPKITFVNPDDESQEIEYLKTKGDNHGIVKSIWFKAGRGRKYIKTKLSFNNAEDNETREIREQRVENEETGDYLMVERIESFKTKWSKGRRFQRKRVHLKNSEEDLESYDGPCKVQG